MNLRAYWTPEMKLWALRAYLTLRQFAISSWQFGSALVSATYVAYQPNVYVFFDGYDFPFKASTLTTETPGTPRPYWYYNATTKLFYKTSPHGESHTFSFLSMSLSFSNMNLHSLDDFLSQQHYIGDQPPPLVVIGAWCQMNGIVLDKALDFKIHVITELGEEKQYGPWSLTWKECITPKNIYSVPKPSRRLVNLRPTPPIETDSLFGGVPIGTQIPENVVPERQQFLMKECDAADSETTSNYAAYPASFDMEITEEVTRLRKSTTVTEPPAESSAPVDLSGSEVKGE